MIYQLTWINYRGLQQIFNRELEYFVLEITLFLKKIFSNKKKQVPSNNCLNIRHDQISRSCLTVIGSSSIYTHEVNSNKDLFYGIRLLFRRLNFIFQFLFFFIFVLFVNYSNFSLVKEFQKISFRRILINFFLDIAKHLEIIIIFNFIWIN